MQSGLDEQFESVKQLVKRQNIVLVDSVQEQVEEAHLEENVQSECEMLIVFVYK